MSQESKQVDPAKGLDGADDAPSPIDKKDAPGSAHDSGSDDEVPVQGAPGPADGSGKKKKKKKKSKGKAKDESAAQEAISKATDKTADALSKLSPKQIQEFLSLNPALLNHLQQSGSSTGDATDAFKKLNIQEIMTGLATSGKNVKDMGAYKFWATQPVPQFNEKPDTFKEGPLRIQKVEDISTEHVGLALDGFEWVLLDLTNEKEMTEVEDILNGHYVEDDEAMFRLKYSSAVLKWSLLSPGWKKQWHVGVRVNKKLCAFISAIPVEIRVRDQVMHSSEVNFLCIHKKLRGKRLAPVLIQEITRVINLEGIWQAIYTGGVVLPRPVSTCRYYHRALDWKKLYEVGFSPLPAGTKEAFQIRKYKLPEDTATRGLREMQAKDVDAVDNLLNRYLKRYDLAPVFNREEIEHWFLNPNDKSGDKVVYSYVVEDGNGKITDFFSFFRLESSVIKSPKHSSIRAGYLFYYATEEGLTTPVDKAKLEKRLNALMGDALILAKRYKFDVFNALSLMDNALFLEQQKFGPGDGQLHYYLFNYKAKPIAGGVDARNQLDKEGLSGVGFVNI
ncbi:acyl-CoA N-acyltransferase [Cercophora newfieldiana]|uniref:Glycylpeptide N-tetradecanoyltransferase n=1 Tax=Cercophora newfieldiana TaxID=92897 RepID=A0AA39YDJ7_9PEZI|nr:acyl-CoA N-acyltransferase [Cercophora newfieldiana]